MKKFRPVLSALMALALVMSLALPALAVDVATRDEFVTAFNEATESDVHVNITASIDLEGTSLNTQQGYTYTVTSDAEGNTLANVMIQAAGGEGATVTIGTESTNIDIVSDGTGLAVSGSVDVTVHGDVSSEDDDSYGILAGMDSSVTVEGSVTTTGDASFGILAEGGDVTVNGDITTSGESSYGVSATNGTVLVDGDVTTGGDYADGIDANDATVTVTGSVHTSGFETDVVNASGDSQVTVSGGITAEGVYSAGVYADDDTRVQVEGGITLQGEASYGIYAFDDANVSVQGDVTAGSGDPDSVDYSNPEAYSDGGDGIYVYDNATVYVEGNVTGGDSYGTYGYGGDGVEAFGESTVTVTGNVTGGSVTADPDTVSVDSNYSLAGYGVLADSTATITVGGSVTGGSTNGHNGMGRSGLYIEYVEGDQGSATVGGSATGGTGSTGLRGGIYLDNDDDLTVEEALGHTITVGGYTFGEGEDFSDEDLQQLFDAIRVTSPTGSTTDTFWSEVAHDLRQAEKGATLTVDAGGRTAVPAYVAQLAVELGVTLVIQWNGGADVTIGADFSFVEGKTNYTLAELAE